MAIAARIRRVALIVLLGFGGLLWLAALLRFSQIAENSDNFAQVWDWVVLINTIGIAGLAGLIFINVARLLSDYRRHVPGVRLRLRMVLILVALAVTPLVIVFMFSVAFINRGIDNWFSLDIEQGLGDALELSQTALDIQKRETLEELERIGRLLAAADDAELVSVLESLRREAGALEMTFYDTANRPLATSHESLDASLPRFLTEEAAFQLQQGAGWVSLEPRANDAFEIRAAVNVVTVNDRAETRVLQAVFPVEQRLGTLANAVQTSFNQYAELNFLREALKASFSLTLGLVLLVSVLAAVYGAFFFAERLLVPIQQLMQGTRAVARGDFDTLLPSQRSDEIGFLVNSFNDMTVRLSRAREDASRSQQLVEEQRKQLEVTLAELTTGVLSLDPDLSIRTANHAAGAILGVDLGSHIGEPLPDVAASHPQLWRFLDVALEHLRQNRTEWREQILLQGEVGRRVLMCACTALPVEASEEGGVVLVFDDITALLQAQKDAAWGEVARRLAHEIKNPLTPIQLSAERLRRRYLGHPIDDTELLDRATHTIIQQVVAMKEMVDAFSQYARTPDMEMTLIDLNELIREVAELYKAQAAVIDLVLDPEMPRVEADMGRMRQVFHNLIRNALEAVEERPEGRIVVTSNASSERIDRMVEISVADNGPGFDEALAHEAFEPYVTSKAKGTGLGLAIVKKIIEEHGGQIQVANAKPQGASVNILLPTSGGGAMVSSRDELKRRRA